MREASAFKPVQVRGELRIPVPLLAPPFPALDASPAGTPTSAGEAVAVVPPSAPAALAPVRGTVTGVSRAALTSGREAPAVRFEPAADQPDEDEAPLAPAGGEAKLRELLATIRAADLSRCTDKLRLAGVWADRWTSPDLLGQLTQCLKRTVDTVVCSTLDLDDALPLQAAVAREHAVEIVAAVAVRAAVAGATRALVILDDATEEACGETCDRWAKETGVRALRVRNSYPRANPTLLLHAVTGRQLRPGRLPTEVGVVLLDAVAAAAAGRCLLYDQPLLRTPVGLADMDGGGHHLLSAPVGGSLNDVVRDAAVVPAGLELRGGSPLREVRLHGDCVVSGGGEVAIYLVGAAPAVNPQPCIRCAWCVAGCPVHIHPAGILQAAQVNDRTQGEHYGLDACIECGICSYVCPSQLPLLPGIRALRNAPRVGV